MSMLMPETLDVIRLTVKDSHCALVIPRIPCSISMWPVFSSSLLGCGEELTSAELPPKGYHPLPLLTQTCYSTQATQKTLVPSFSGFSEGKQQYALHSTGRV